MCIYSLSTLVVEQSGELFLKLDFNQCNIQLFFNHGVYDVCVRTQVTWPMRGGQRITLGSQFFSSHVGVCAYSQMPELAQKAHLPMELINSSQCSI